MTGNGPESTPTTPNHPPTLRFDWQDWLPYLSDVDIPDDQKRELIETLWAIVISFVDLGFDLATAPPTDESCGQAIDLKALLEAAVIHSEHNPDRQEAKT